MVLLIIMLPTTFLCKIDCCHKLNWTGLSWKNAGFMFCPLQFVLMLKTIQINIGYCSHVPKFLSCFNTIKYVAWASSIFFLNKQQNNIFTAVINNIYYCHHGWCYCCLTCNRGTDLMASSTSNTLIIFVHWINDFKLLLNCVGNPGFS